MLAARENMFLDIPASTDMTQTEEVFTLYFYNDTFLPIINRTKGWGTWETTGELMNKISIQTADKSETTCKLGGLCFLDLKNLQSSVSILICRTLDI